MVVCYKNKQRNEKKKNPNLKKGRLCNKELYMILILSFMQDAQPSGCYFFLCFFSFYFQLLVGNLEPYIIIIIIIIIMSFSHQY